MKMIPVILRSKLFGQLVGEDEFGTKYYQDKKPGAYGRKRRWALYNGEDEASRVPAHWHGWLHYTVDEPPQSAQYSPNYDWQKPHHMNDTGTSQAFRPSGTLYANNDRPPVYEAWSPEAKS